MARDGRGDARFPIGDKQIPSGDASVPSGDASVPNGDASVPNGDASVPNGDASVPNGDASVPSGDEPVPSGDEPVPSGDEPVPSGDEPVPSGGRRRSTGETAASAAAARAMPFIGARVVLPRTPEPHPPRPKPASVAAISRDRLPQPVLLLRGDATDQRSGGEAECRAKTLVSVLGDDWQQFSAGYLRSLGRTHWPQVHQAQRPDSGRAHHFAQALVHESPCNHRRK